MNNQENLTYQQRWYRKNKDRLRDRLNLAARKSYIKHKDRLQKERKERWQLIKIKVLGHYSGGLFRCNNCGFGESIFCLDLDHIENDGAQKRKLVRQNTLLFPRLIKANYPKGYQVLCRNCNWIKYLNTLIK